MKHQRILLQKFDPLHSTMSKLASSIYSLLTGQSKSGSRQESRVEEIRLAMIDSLGDDGASTFPQITRRIRYAGDVYGLWYLRGELMAALSKLKGEAVAQEKIASITEMFRGLLPGGLSSRPSPLTS